jgi:cytochrome c553
MKRVVMLSLLMVLVASLTLAGVRAKDKVPGHTTKEVMKAVKGGLLKHVLEQTATVEQQHILLEYVKSLPDNKPPKGDAASWKMKTRELIKATNAVVKGRSGAIERLTKASNCKACHGVHKVYPPKS